MTGAGVVYRARAYDAPHDPFTTSGPAFRYDDDLGLAVSDEGVITDRGPFAAVGAPAPGVLEGGPLSGGQVVLDLAHAPPATACVGRCPTA